jgi:opacity protein-like surface antigen
MKKIIIFLCGIVLLFGSPLSAEEVSKVGTTAAGFLNIDTGARAVGMGSAFSAVSDDISAVYWNPAGVARITRNSAMFSNTKWIADISFNFAAVVVPMGPAGVIGMNATFLTMDDMERTTISQPDGTGETFSAGSYAFGICYARDLTDRFSIGANMKYINEQIYHSTAQGVAFDIGTLFDTQFHGLRIGMSISNYGTKMQMSGRDMLTQVDVDPLVSGNNENINANLQTDKYDLPLMFRVGLSLDLLKGKGNSNLLLSVDALHPNDDTEYVNVGGEYLLNNMFALRAGYKTLFARDSEEGLALGAGLKYELGGRASLKLDYAFQEFGALNDIQMVTVGIGF